MMKDQMDVVENEDNDDKSKKSEYLVSSARRKRPVVRTKRRKRKGTFSKYSKLSERSLLLIRKRKQEAMKEEDEEEKEEENDDEKVEDEPEKTEQDEQRIAIERQRLLETSGLNQVNVSISNTTKAELEPGEEISTNIGLDVLGTDLEALADLQISEADMDILEEEEEDEYELLLKEKYEGNNVIVAQVKGKCENGAIDDSNLVFRLKSGILRITGETYLMNEGLCTFMR